MVEIAKGAGNGCFALGERCQQGERNGSSMELGLTLRSTLMTCHPLLLFLPRFFLSSSTALGFTQLSSLWFHSEQRGKRKEEEIILSHTYAHWLIRCHLCAAAEQAKTSRTWGWSGHVYLICMENQRFRATSWFHIAWSSPSRQEVCALPGISEESIAPVRICS